MVKTNNNNALRDRRGDRNPLQLRILGGFTLAEVLITIGIIGVVAAMVIPSLISSFQKKIYYTKFMKARNVLENGLKLYEKDYGELYTDWNKRAPTSEEVENFSKYFRSPTLITTGNYKDVCKGYDKIKIHWNYDKSGNSSSGSDTCGPSFPGGRNIGFITGDGILFKLNSDYGSTGEGAFVDTNGPDNGPNTFGRDMFLFFLNIPVRDEFLCGNRWGRNSDCFKKRNINRQWSCYENGKDGRECGARLIEEGKMNY